MTTRIIILGLSTYTHSLVEHLHAQGGAEIVVVDKDEERVNAVADQVSRPIIGNATNYDLLAQLDVPTADYVVISLGSLENSLISLLYLQELKAPYVIVKALNDEHVKILELLRVSEIVFPEKQAAELTAVKLLHPNILGISRLNEQDSLAGVVLPAALVGTPLAQLKVKAKYDMELALVIDGTTRKVALPDDDYLIQAGDILIVAGNNQNLYRFERELR